MRSEEKNQYIGLGTGSETIKKVENQGPPGSYPGPNLAPPKQLHECEGEQFTKLSASGSAEIFGDT